MKKKILTVFLLACALALSAAPAAWAATVNYAVTGGNITFDTATGTITGCDKTVTAAEIPATIQGVSVKAIGNSAFYGCTGLTSVTIPDSVTSIGNLAFYACENLTDISLPAELETIGNRAFSWCRSFTSIDIPDKTKSVGDGAFYGCSILSQISIPASVTSLGEGVLGLCEKLETINLAGDNQYYSLDANGVLFNKDKTTLIAYPMGKAAGSYNIPASVTTIGAEAFAGAGKLSSVTIPASVEKINELAFIFTGAMENIDVDANNSHYYSDNGVLIDLDKTTLLQYPLAKTVTEYSIPSGVTIVADRSFSGAIYLTTVKIPESVTEIEVCAFESCGELKAIWLPKTLNKIDQEAFNGCSKLTDVYYAGSQTEWQSIDINTTLNAPLTNATIHYNSPISEGSADVPVVGVFLNETDLSLPANGTATLTTKFNPINATNKKVTWESSDTSVATVDANGKVTAVAVGTATITVTAADGGKTATCEVTVTGNETKIPVTSVTLNKTALDLEVNGAETLQATVAPANAANKDVTWKSSNTSVATVDADGKVTAVAPGNATITVTTADGNKTATCTVTVVEKKIPVTAITLDKTELTLEVKTTAQLKATVEPTDTTSTISWTSSDEKVATVDSTGKVTPLTKGTATITAAADGVKATCEVTVTADTVYTITFDTDGGTLAAGITNPDYVIKGKEYKMPTASKSSYTLTAWAIGAKDSENLVNANDVYTFTDDTTVYAIWKYNGGGGGGSSSRPTTSGGTTTSGTTTTTPGTTTPGTTTSGSNTVTAANINNVFADVQNNAWYSEAIAYVYNNGIMNGTENGFEPNATTTRAMLVTMLFRLEGEPAAGNPAFSDVVSGQWFSDAIAWASANGVVNGYENGLFGPNDSITREQLAVILYRFAQLKGYAVSANGSLSSFSDSGSVSDWAQEAMQWAVGAGIINGDNGALKPAGNATRAEVAMMLMRFSENIAK